MAKLLIEGFLDGKLVYRAVQTREKQITTELPDIQIGRFSLHETYKDWLSQYFELRAYAGGYGLCDRLAVLDWKDGMVKSYQDDFNDADRNSVFARTGVKSKFTKIA